MRIQASESSKVLDHQPLTTQRMGQKNSFNSLSMASNQIH